MGTSPLQGDRVSIMGVDSAENMVDAANLFDKREVEADSVTKMSILIF